MTDPSTISRLMAWYRDQCNGDWEHSFGIRIGTLDNPGWTVDIDLEDTDLEDRDFATKKIYRSDSDWIFCSKEDKKFSGGGGSDKLEQIILIFLEWASQGDTA